MEGLRPLRVGEILDAAIKLYLRNWRVLMGAAAAVAVPLHLVTGAILASAYSQGDEISSGLFNSTTLTRAQANARLGATGINAFIDLIITGFVVAACTRAISDTYLGQEAAIGSSLRAAARRLAPLIVVQILYVIGVVLGFILLIVPGVWLYAAWSVAIPALVVERVGPLRALRRSRQLVSGRWRASAAVLLLANVMVGVVGGVLTELLGGLALGSDPTVAAAVVVSTLSGIVVTILLQPFTATVYTVLYYDLRVRKDGYDIERLAEDLGLPKTALPAAPTGGPVGPESVGQPGGPPYWPPPPGWTPGQ